MEMIDKALGVHAQALGLRSKRMEVLARNIANADTPHFKAKDIDFRSVLKQTKESALNTTSNLHMAMPMEAKSFVCHSMRLSTATPWK